MPRMKFKGHLDRGFITIYFMQGKRRDYKLAMRRLSLLLGMMLLAFGLIFFRVWQEMQIVKLGYAINQLRQQYRSQLDQHRILLSQRNALGNLERIEALAREKLDLEIPQGDKIIFLVDPGMQDPGFKAWLPDWLHRWLYGPTSGQPIPQTADPTVY